MISVRVYYIVRRNKVSSLPIRASVALGGSGHRGALAIIAITFGGEMSHDGVYFLV